MLAVFDLPAKAMALNCMQFNGQYGCPYCLDEGTYYTLHRRLYYLPDNTHQPRSITNMKEWADEAEKTGKPIFGIKGRSILSSHLNVLKCIPIDYMHAVLEGVTKSLIYFWFDSKNHTRNFYLGKERPEHYLESNHLTNFDEHQGLFKPQSTGKLQSIVLGYFVILYQCFQSFFLRIISSTSHF